MSSNIGIPSNSGAATASNMTLSCGHCGKTETDAKLRRCSQCHFQYYCGEDCQKKHWPQHKLICKPIEKPKDLPAIATESKAAEVKMIAAALPVRAPGLLVQQPPIPNFDIQSNKELYDRISNLAPTQAELATSYNNIAETYRNLGELTQALENYQKALKIRLESLGDHPDVYGTLRSVIACAAQVPAAQVKNLQYTCFLCKKFLGEQNPLVQELIQLIATTP